MTTVSRTDRLTDLAALLLIVLGVAMYLHGSAQLRALSALSYQHPGPRGQSALAAADHARIECYAAVAVALGGCAVGVWSALRHARRRTIN